jgi:hypothetical protein
MFFSDLSSVGPRYKSAIGTKKIRLVYNEFAYKKTKVGYL